MGGETDEAGDEREAFVQIEEKVEWKKGEDGDADKLFGENCVLFGKLNEIVEATGETNGGEEEKEIAREVDDEDEEGGDMHNCCLLRKALWSAEGSARARQTE